jgi:hypothetical protein
MSKQTEAMKLDKDDIETAKGMALTMQKCQTPELVVVGNLLAQLLAEREATLAREWRGLTQEEIDLVWDSVPETQFWWRHYGQAIEAKLREKNV